MGQVNKLAIIGLGLIGSSIAHATRRKNLAAEIAGYDSSADVRERAKVIGFCDVFPADIAEAVKDADLVIVAADPSIDVANMRKIRYVVRGGVVRGMEDLHALAQ